jgi:hypothetical protein
MIFFTSFKLSTYVHELNHSLLIYVNSLFTSCILHLLEYFETHAIQCFVIILNSLVFFFTFFELSTSLHELNHTF